MRHSAVFPAANSPQPAFTFGEFRLEPDGTLLRGKTEIHLAPKELDALRLLLERGGQIVTPAELRDRLWGDVHVTADSVPRCISSLRSRLGSEDSIRAIYKRGYRLTWPVERERAVPNDLPRVAIMPFDCAAHVPEHLGKAVAEEATARLTEICPPLLSVLARDSVFALAAQGLSALQAGEMLKAHLVLTGTVRAMTSHYRLRVEMIRIQDGTQIWVEDILVSRTETAALESELVNRILFRLGADPSAARREISSPVDPQAYEEFLRGRYAWHTSDRHLMHDGMRHLRHAIDLDPHLNSARAELVQACLAQECFGYATPTSVAEQVRRIAAEAPPDAAGNEALAPALGWLAFHVDRDLPAALKLFEPCQEVCRHPWHAQVRWLLALSRRQFSAASELLHKCLEADPYAPWLNADLAWTLHAEGRTAESVRQAEHCLKVAPHHPVSSLFAGIILAYNNQAKAAVPLTRDLLRTTPHFDMALAAHAYALACDNQRDEALEVLERLQWLGRERFTMRSFSAAAYLALGDGESALAELQAANLDRCPWYFAMLADPRLEPLRGAPEFQALESELAAMEEAAGEALEDAEFSGVTAR
jgi:DNA-binding winged helix-turn-helix (wHTH) protein/tetratricopeptide (TPR) repeat protein